MSTDCDPLVSAVMPAYNRIEFMDEAVSSILAQTHRHLELIIVDDGSDQDVGRFSGIDPRVTLLRKAHGGTGSALNLGFALAGGDFGTYVSNDNVYYPMMLEALLAALRSRPDCVLAYSDYDRINKDGRVCAITHRPFAKEFLHMGYQMGICYLFRMNAKKQVGLYSEEICEDYDMAVRLATRGDFILVRGALGAFRDHFGNLSNTRADEVRAATERIRNMARELI